MINLNQTINRKSNELSPKILSFETFGLELDHKCLPLNYYLSYNSIFKISAFKILD